MQFCSNQNSGLAYAKTILMSIDFFSNRRVFL